MLPIQFSGPDLHAVAKAAARRDPKGLGAAVKQTYRNERDLQRLFALVR